MSEFNRYQQYPPPSKSISRASAHPFDFKELISASLNKHKTEEIRVNEHPYSSNKTSAEMTLRDQQRLLQKLANAEYLQKVASLRKRPGLETKGKRPASKTAGQHETIHVDKELIKRRKLEPPADSAKTREFLTSRELAQLEAMATEVEKREDDSMLLEYFGLLLKRNCGLVGVGRGELLTRVDMKMLNLILNKFKAHMYILISNWVYQEYNLYLTTSIPVYYSRYKDILKEFSNAIEDKASEELGKSMEGWYSYVWSLPYITSRVFENIYTMCIKEDPKNAIEPFFDVPLRLLKDLIMSRGHKEEVKQKTLSELLRLSTCPKDAVKVRAIKMLAPELYADPKCRDVIGKYALESFGKLKEARGMEDENAVNCQIGLLLRISAEDPQMLLDGIKKFGVVNAGVRNMVLGQYRRMFEKCWNPNREELQKVFEEVPKESAQVVQTYVEAYKNTSFPGALKKSLIGLAKKLSNYQLLQPLIPQISQSEIDANELIKSAACAECPGKLEFIYGLVQNMSKSTNYCEKFRKTLTQLHEFTLPIGKNVVEVIDMCIDKRDLFELDDVILPTLTELAERDEVPVLLPRTLIKVSAVYPRKVVACLNIIKILLDKEMWKVNAIAYGIVQYLQKYESAVRAHMEFFDGECADWVRKVIGGK